MSGDLTQRLREVGAEALSVGGCQECGLYGEDALDAADEIERLQADNDHLAAGATAWIKQNRSLSAEVVRLQQALRDVLDVLYDPPPDDDNDRWFTVLAAARAVLNGDQQ